MRILSFLVKTDRASSMAIGKDPEEIIRIAMLGRPEETTALADSGEEVA